jgi:hypothetical protein
MPAWSASASRACSSGAISAAGPSSEREAHRGYPGRRPQHAHGGRAQGP